MRWLGPLVPFGLGVGFCWFALREQRLAVAGRRRFLHMSQLDLLAGPFALFVYGTALIGTAIALWVSG